MLDWLDRAAGPAYTQAVFWTLLALLLLVIVLVVVRIVRSMTFGTYVAGGRNRKTRLAVMDATAIDSHRRLVLVRRDDTEHLLLIGGTSDVVVERDIRISQARRNAAGEPAPEPVLPVVPPAAAPALPRIGEAPRPVQPRPAPQAPAAPRPLPERPVSIVPRPQEPRLPPRVEPAATVATPAATSPPALPTRPQTAPVVASPPPVSRPSTGAPVATAPVVSPPPAPQTPPVQPAPANTVDELDDALLRELEVSLDGTDPRPGRGSPSLDDEMAKLLGELSTPRR